MTINEMEMLAIHSAIIEMDPDLDVIYNKINKGIFYEGVNITRPLMALHKEYKKISSDVYREKLSKVFGIPMDMLFPETKKYNFVQDKKPKVYLSGKVSGLEPKVYKNQFNSAELYLTGLGYDVVNPVSYTEDPNWTWKDYMKRDLKLLLDCDYIYPLEGWEDSAGATIECNLADSLGIKVLTLDENGKVL